MGFEDQLLNVAPPRCIFPKDKARVLEKGAERCPSAKPSATEETLKAKHQCPPGGLRAMNTASDPTVDNSRAEAEMSPPGAPVSGSPPDCGCLTVSRSLGCLDDGNPDAGEIIVAGGDDGSTSALNAPLYSTPSDRTTEETEDDCLSAGYETPTKSVFNPFAPGPEELGEFAPMILAKGSRVRRFPLRRQLQFDSCDSSSSSGGDDADDETAKAADLTDGRCPPIDNEMDEEEKKLLGSLYATQYNFILSSMLDEQSSSPGRESSSQSEEGESPRTPTSAPFLTGVAETCPGAPMRRVSKARKLDPAICRKLDFS